MSPLHLHRNWKATHTAEEKLQPFPTDSTVQALLQMIDQYTDGIESTKSKPIEHFFFSIALVIFEAKQHSLMEAVRLGW